MNRSPKSSIDIAEHFALLGRELNNLSSAAAITTENIAPLLRELKLMLQNNAKSLEANSNVQGKVLEELKELRADLKELRVEMEERFMALEDEVRLGADNGSLG